MTEKPSPNKAIDTIKLASREIDKAISILENSVVMDRETWERYERIIKAAIQCVSNPSFIGVCDEDVELERAVREWGITHEQL
jgi:hypothetical protein